MADKVDRRVARTKKSIEDAFEKLVGETDYSKITVSAIAKEANINRKTFYLHYSSVEDVLDSLTKQHAQRAVRTIAEQGLFEKRPLDADAIAQALGESYREARLFNPLFMRKLPISHLIDAAQPQLENFIAKAREEQGLPPKKNLGYYVRFFLGGLFQAYESWYNAGDDVPFESIAKDISLALTSGLDGLLSK